jgi:molybdopterin-guanine dinucleotide biosynthesis protein A
LLCTESGLSILETIDRELAPAVRGVVIVAPKILESRLVSVLSRPVIRDARRGPGMALVEVARALETTWLLAVGGDQPKPSRRLLERLLACAQDDADADAVAVEIDGRREPLWALYRRRSLLATELPEHPPEAASLQALLGRLRVLEISGRELDADERACFLDVDTLEDAARLGLIVPRTSAALAPDPEETG